MANVVNQKKVLILDTVADNIVAAGVKVLVTGAVIIGVGAGVVTFADAGGSQAKMELAATAANDMKSVSFDPPMEFNGLRMLANAGANRVYLFCTD